MELPLLLAFLGTNFLLNITPGPAVLQVVGHSLGSPHGAHHHGRRGAARTGNHQRPVTDRRRVACRPYLTA
ncbi:hypothetical protein [Noviherbaspirillum sp.]|uniref:hypothetical protein n=1 Tax=Noviherbaspirillum sp. TaxID=1926288 RepID=UPI002FE01405